MQQIKSSISFQYVPGVLNSELSSNDENNKEP